MIDVEELRQRCSQTTGAVCVPSVDMLELLAIYEKFFDMHPDARREQTEMAKIADEYDLDPLREFLAASNNPEGEQN